MMNAITGTFATQFLSKPDVGGRHYDVIYKRKRDGRIFAVKEKKMFYGRFIHLVYIG